MKKKVVWALALTLLLGGLTACGGKDSASAKASESDAAASGAVSQAPEKEKDADASSSALPEQGAQAQSSTPQTPADTAPQPAPQQPAPQQPAPQKQPSAPVSGGAAAPQKQPSAPAQPAPKAPAVADVAAAVEGALAPEAELMSFTAEDLSSLYGLDASAAEGFVGKMPMMNVKATEYLVVKAAPGQTETVKQAMQTRQQALDATWKQYLPDQYALVKDYKLVANGDYVLFAVGENAQGAVDAFNNLTK